MGGSLNDVRYDFRDAWVGFERGSFDRIPYAGRAAPWDHLPEIAVDAIMNTHGHRLTFRLPLAPGVFEIADQLLFFVSTEITGAPRAWNFSTRSLMNSNCSLRSGCDAPSSVLLVDCKL
jgi:hypothetical protein